MTITKWRQWVKAVKRAYPIDTPINVRRCRMKKNFGITSFNGRVFNIRIDSSQEDAIQVDTLLHEYAHAAAIDEAYNHNEAWGVVYSKLVTQCVSK
jgi:hypothetical protein